MTIIASVVSFQREHWLTRYFPVITIDLTETAIHNCGCSLAVEVLDMSQLEEYGFVSRKNIITNAIRLFGEAVYRVELPRSMSYMLIEKR